RIPLAKNLSVNDRFFVKKRIEITPETEYLFESVPLERFQTLTKEELIQFIHGLQSFNDQLLRQNKSLQHQAELLKSRTLLLGEQFVVLKNKVYGRSSEKVARPETLTGEDLEGPKKEPRRRVRLPSERYPEAPLIEQ